MAGNAGWPSLSQEQQRLLLSALTSGKGAAQAYNSRPSFGGEDVKPSQLQNGDSTGLPPGAFEKSDDIFGTFDTSVDQFTFDDKVQSSPEDVNLFDAEFGEKRKSPDDEADEEDDIDPKRRDSNDDKTSKKPGRKPITTEPTTKRKAQNRAAQRAFRERKEKHLKDLESKVKELEQASTAANEENSLLRAQVTKLQGELKEYKKRMSFTGSGSPPRTSDSGNNMFGSGFSDFNFDFTKFGSPQYNSPSNTNDSTSRGASPNDNSVNGFSPATTNGSTSQNPNNSLYGFFDVNTNPYGFGEGKIASGSPSHYYSNKHQSSVDAGASTASSAASPSSDSQKATSCSSCTSPGIDDYALGKTGETPDITKQPSLTWPSITSQAKDTTSDLASFDWLASQNGGIFDPVLFGGYRESQDAVIGDGDFTSGFFEDPLNFDDDITASLNENSVANVSKNEAQPNLLQQVEKQQEAAQYDNVEPRTPRGSETKGLYTAQAVWNQLQHCPKFQSGDFDLDGLCADLKKKAKCSESGMAIPENAVKDALWRLAGAEPEQKAN